jgi:hypothetical protein
MAEVRLDPRTIRLMEEAFGSQPCRVCGGPSIRLLHGKFFCQEHLPDYPNLIGERPRTKVRRCKLHIRHDFLPRNCR